VEKLSLSLEEVVSKLKMVSEPALENWSRSLDGVISGELLEYFKQRVKFALCRIDRGLITELNRNELPLEGDDIAPQVLLLDAKEYKLVKEELSKAFKEQIDFSYLETFDKQAAENQIQLFVQVLEDAIAINLMSALFNLAERLENEKRHIRKALDDITETLERDRQRLAFDLHDGPAQALSSALLQADILEDMTQSAEAKEELESLKSILGQCLHELRTSIYSLKPQSMLQKGLVAKIKGYVKQFSLATGIEVDVLVEQKEPELPEVIEVNIFRIVQEALNNVYKHAQASRACIKVIFSESKVSCIVEDDGVGFDVSGQGDHMKGLSGYGLISMRDRVGQFLGTFCVDSKLGEGTRITFSIPMPGS